MVFKKKKLIKKTNNFMNIFWLLMVVILVWLWFYVVKSVDLKLWWITNSSWQTIEWQKEIKKEVNILMVWRWWWNHDAPELTDTIILAKVNRINKTVSLLSLQRDLYVNYPDKDGTWKLNSVYAHYFYKENKNEKAGMAKLAEKIKDITGEDVDYYVNVDFSWFKQIIDTLGWVEIDVKESFTDTTYPNENWWYQTVSFKKWLQLMNWDQALKFSRSRHSTSDFDRSLRQQQVIQAVKNKLTSNLLQETSPAKIVELYNVFTKYLSTDIWVTDAISLALDLWLLKENYRYISSNFNDTSYSETSVCEKWWILYVPKRDLFWWQWVSLVNWSTTSTLSNYELSKKYSNIVLHYPMVEAEDYKINIFNGSKVSWAGAMVNNMKRYWFKFTDKKFVSNAPETIEKSVIYYNWIDENTDTIKALKEFFKWEFIKISEPKYSTEKAIIEIVLWKDYAEDKNIFNF